MKYIVLLRGVNVGGNNKVSMADLKLLFEDMGFNNVVTYINSDNIIFETKNKLDIDEIENNLYNRFGFNIRIAAITVEELQEALENAPSWWGKGEDLKHNAIFVIEPAKVEEIIKEVGDIKPAYEQVVYYKKNILVSFCQGIFKNKIVQNSWYNCI